MSTFSPVPVCREVAKPSLVRLLPKILARLADYTEIAKPRISLMVLITVSCGFVLAMESASISPILLHACLGVAVVAFGSSAVNQWVERETDGVMRRTMNRPLPSRRLAAAEVLMFGLAAAIVGCAYLALTVNITTAALTGLTFVLYAFVYTPMKRTSSLCTVVGAVPGALPPVLGWFAAGGRWDVSAFALFGILFLWQFPHFFAIAWLYRDDYRQAGLKMLPRSASLPHVTGLLAVAYALGLIPISLLPSHYGMAGSLYSIVAIVLGASYLIAALMFAWNETRSSARRLLWTSLVYLPVLLLTLVFDHQRMLDRLLIVGV